MFFRKKEKKTELSEYKKKDREFKFIDKLTGYRIVSSTVINKHSGKINDLQIAYEIFKIYCSAVGLEASYRKIDGELWFESVDPDRPKVSQSRVNTVTANIQAYRIEHSILQALYAVSQGIKKPFVDGDNYMNYKNNMNIILSLWAVGYELDAITFKSSEHNYILQDARKIIDDLWETTD